MLFISMFLITTELDSNIFSFYTGENMKNQDTLYRVMLLLVIEFVKISKICQLLQFY